MTPVGGVLTLAFSLSVLLLPKRAAMLGVMGAVCYLTQGQFFEIVGVSFTAVRVVLLVGLLRVTADGEYRARKVSTIDRTMAASTFCLFVVSLMREGSAGFIYQAGRFFDTLTPYFLARCFLRDRNDVRFFLDGTALLLTPLAILMAAEASNGINWFSVMGGPPLFVENRNGYFRCQGPFRSPITAGTLGATFAPLFAGLLFERVRVVALLGMGAATLIMIFSHSSGPLLAYGAAVLSLGLWSARSHMRAVRWTLIIGIVLLQFVMKAPVWYVLARIGDLVGGGGYHRAAIVDRFIANFGSWWLTGMTASETANWIAYQLANGSADLTNQFVVAGVSGGLIGLILFVALISQCFGQLGTAMLEARLKSPNDEKLLWAFGAALVCTVASFFSVSYFDQIGVVLSILLASIAVITDTGSPLELRSQAISPRRSGRQNSRPSVVRVRQLDSQRRGHSNSPWRDVTR